MFLRRMLGLAMAGMVMCQVYWLGVREDGVWVLDEAGRTWRAEGICVQALPELDRQRLEAGLRADSLPELTGLLEDLYP